MKTTSSFLIVTFFLTLLSSCNSWNDESKRSNTNSEKINQENLKSETRSGENVDLTYFLDGNKNINKIIEKATGYKTLDSEYSYYFNNNKLTAIKGHTKIYPVDEDSTVFEKIDYAFENDSLIQSSIAEIKLSNEFIYGTGELTDDQISNNLNKIWSELKFKNKAVRKNEIKDIFESIEGYKELLNDKAYDKPVHSPF